MRDHHHLHTADGGTSWNAIILNSHFPSLSTEHSLVGRSSSELEQILPSDVITSQASFSSPAKGGHGERTRLLLEEWGVRSEMVTGPEISSWSLPQSILYLRKASFQNFHNLLYWISPCVNIQTNLWRFYIDVGRLVKCCFQYEYY